MSASVFRYVYGPVPSRRLGHSLGIDLVPFKTCTYDCIYCQQGRTTNKTIARKEYVPVKEVLTELQEKLALGKPPDHITISGSGEPTLNTGIGDLIERIKGLTNIPVAVLTNGSLLWMSEVQDALMGADLVLPSLDAGDEPLFRHVNRPHPELTFDGMVSGIAEFRERFQKPVWLEVFLLAGVTGILSEVEKVASIARRIRSQRVHLNTVTRPPSETYAFPVTTGTLEGFTPLFDPRAEVLADFRTPGTPSAGAISTEDILALLSRRPCTIKDVAKGLFLHVIEATKQLEKLKASGEVVEVFLNGQRFYTAAGHETLW